MAAVQILVVEDEALVARDLCLRLEAMGHKVLDPVASAEEAIAAAAAGRPDLILMDVRLQGGTDGIDAAARIRAQLGLAVIYLTAHGDDATFERARRTEPLGYLLKPIDDRSLRISVELALDRLRGGRTGAEELPRGTEVVLVAEDDDGVRALTRALLQACGYTVLEAADGFEALRRDTEDGPADLLLTDVMMPGMTGHDLAARLRAQRPGLKVVFMSGYPPEMVHRQGVPAEAPFVQKPFTPAELMNRLREVLGGR